MPLQRNRHKAAEPGDSAPGREARLAIARRGILGSALAAGLLPAGARAATPAPLRLVADTRMLEVNGRPARVFGLLGPDGKPGLRLAPGERFRVALLNRTGMRTIVHWHGQLPPWTQDGFPWPQTPPIAAGATHGYDYAPIAGTYWMHSHHGLQEQQLLTAPLIVEDAAALRAGRQEVVLMLHDFTFRSPDAVLAGLLQATPEAARDMVRRGETEVQIPTPGMSMPHGMDMPMPERAQAMPAMRMDLNDVTYDAFLANDRTLADPQVVRVERSGRVRLRIINGASASQFWIDLRGLTGQVVATDGHPVHPIAGQGFPLAIAQRLDILLDLPADGAFPVLARLEGTTRQTGIVLATAGAKIPRLGDAAHAAPAVDDSLERRLTAQTPLAVRPADAMHRIVLDGSMRPYAWSMNGQFWPRISPLMLRHGQRVEIALINRSMMAHPIHLHGHAFQVIGIDGQSMRGAMRDTVIVMPRSQVRIAFDADNPGRWAFHCHNLYHMMTGMMTEFRYHGIAV